MPRRIHQEGQRHLEAGCHLRRVRAQGGVAGHEADHGHHEEAGRREIGIEITERTHAALQADLLARLPQGRVDRRGILGIDLAAGKSHLPRMVA